MYFSAVCTLDMSIVSLLYWNGAVYEINKESVREDCVSLSVCLFVSDAVPVTKLSVMARFSSPVQTSTQPHI